MGMHGNGLILQLAEYVILPLTILAEHQTILFVSLTTGELWYVLSSAK